MIFVNQEVRCNLAYFFVHSLATELNPSLSLSQNEAISGSIDIWQYGSVSSDRMLTNTFGIVSAKLQLCLSASIPISPW